MRDQHRTHTTAPSLPTAKRILMSFHFVFAIRSLPRSIFVVVLSTIFMNMMKYAQRSEQNAKAIQTKRFRHSIRIGYIRFLDTIFVNILFDLFRFTSSRENVWHYFECESFAVSRWSLKDRFDSEFAAFGSASAIVSFSLAFIDKGNSSFKFRIVLLT